MTHYPMEVQYDMDSFDHEACKFFDARCRERGLSPKRIKESSGPRPDFRLSIKDGIIVVEVKAIEPNDDDRQDIESLKRGEAVASYLNPGRISKKLRKADTQLRPFVERGIPGLVCICDYTAHGLLNDPSDIHGAMFGKDAQVFSFPRDSPPRFVRLKSAGSETLTQEHNRSVSAVLIFSKGETGRLPYVATLYHNHFARCPIDPNCAAHFVNYQYESGKKDCRDGNAWIPVTATG